MGERLNNPPVLEALCEFRFAPSGNWDWTIPGRLFDRIGNEFSERGQLQVTTVGQVTSAEGKVAAQSLEQSERVQLRRPDGSAMVQTGMHLLTINQLRPYPQWENFLALILRILSAHEEIAGHMPLARVGLRYINQLIEVSDFTKLSDVITLIPDFSDSLAKPILGFYQRYELVHSEPKGIMIHQTGVQVRSGKQLLILDLDFGSELVDELTTMNLVSAWLTAAHDRVYESFVASLTDEAYQSFKGASKRES